MAEEMILRLPAGTKQIEAEAFAGEAWKEVILPEGLERIGEAAFLECTSLERVHLPESLQEIADGAFSSCGSLKEVRLPEGLLRIGEMAFFESGLLRIRVPAQVREIGEMAFWGCDALAYAEVLGTKTRLHKDVFGGSERVPDGYVAPGFPEVLTPWSLKLYLLLWSCNLSRHADEINRRGFSYLKDHTQEWMESVIDAGRVKAVEQIAAAAPVELLEELAALARGHLSDDARLLRNREMRAAMLALSLCGAVPEDDFSL